MGAANPSADRAFASGLSEGPERGSADMQITQPRTAALRQALAAVRNEAAMQDLVCGRVGVATFEQRYLRPDGSAVWVEMNIGSLTDADGTVVGLLAQAVDVDRRKRAQDSTESERRRLQAAQRVAGIGSFEQDAATGGIRL